MAEPESQDLQQDETSVGLVEAKSDVVEIPAPPKRSGVPVFLGLVVGGVLAAAAGFGLARYVVPEGWPSASTAALEAGLAEQSVQLEGLRADLAETTKALSAQPTEDRIVALEAALAKAQAEPAGTVDEGRLSAMEARLTNLEKRPIAQGGAMGAPSAEDDAIAKARLAEAEAQAAALTAEAAALSKKTAIQAALGKVQTAVDSGQPFASQLAELQSSGQSIPELLRAVATDGVPTLQSLQESFPDAARLALDAALRANMGETTTDRLTSFLRTQTGVRSLTPRQGTDPDAILSRAEAALATGDLVSTFGELAALPEEAQSAMSEWQAFAQRRMQTLVSLAALIVEIQ